MSRTQTKVRTETRTRVLVATLAILVLAAGVAFGVAGGFSKPSILTNLQKPLAMTPPGESPLGGTPGVPPGYTPPPGYVPTGYRILSSKPTVANFCSEFDSSVACKSAGWSVCQSISKQPGMQLSRVIKGSGAALYWYGKNGKRYVFPNEATYRTWFPIGSKCPIINQVSDETLASIAIAGNVTARPGVKLIKIQTDPKVYAVSKNGELHWIEFGPKFNSIITTYYGQTWTNSVIELPDPFFTMYSMGTSITDVSQYSPGNASSSSPTIDIDKGL